MKTLDIRELNTGAKAVLVLKSPVHGFQPVSIKVTDPQKGEIEVNGGKYLVEEKIKNGAVVTFTEGGYPTFSFLVRGIILKKEKETESKFLTRIAFLLEAKEKEARMGF